MTGICQVDFYQLGSATLDADRLACRLAMMAWERGHKVTIMTSSANAASRLDDLMWDYPEQRFLPHAVSQDPQADNSPVRILDGRLKGPADVVINLTDAAIEDAGRFSRLLEIVPFETAQRQASRAKYVLYRELGLELSSHEIN